MSVYMTRECERKIEELKHYSTSTIFYGLKDRKDLFKPRIIFKEDIFTNLVIKILLYPLYKSYKEKLEKDEEAVKNIREYAKELRQRDVQLKVLLRNNDVRDEIDLVSFISYDNYNSEECFNLYIRNLFYNTTIYPIKKLMLEDINHVLNCKTLDTERSGRYLTLLRNLKETLEDDIKKGGRSK